jgi:hypothetical protein
MPSLFSIVQYAPAPLSGERINIGVVVCDSNVVQVRFIENWRRVQCFSGDNIDFLKKFVAEAHREIPSRLDPLLSDFDLLRAEFSKLFCGWINSIQFTEPRGSLKDADQLIEDVYQRFIFELSFCKTKRGREFEECDRLDIMPEQLITDEELNSCGCPKVEHADFHRCKVISREDLDSYQYSQMKHDEIYHHDIFVLNIAQRMTHVALHLVKYLTPLSSFPVSAPENKKAFIDSFIMVVSASNLLGILLSKLFDNNEKTRFNETFISEYIRILSNLAKACEAVDHQEDFPIRAIWAESIKKMFFLLIHEASSRNISLIEEASSRLASIEKVYPLNNILKGKE